VEELPSPVVQRRRLDETFFRKSFRHVNNVFRSGLFFYSLPAGILIHIPGIFIQNLSERPIHIARNPQFQVTRLSCASYCRRVAWLWRNAAAVSALASVGIDSIRSWLVGFLNLESYILILTLASTPLILNKSRMRKRARTDLIVAPSREW